MLKYLLLCLLFVNTFACKDNKQPNNTKEKTEKTVDKPTVSLTLPKNGQQIGKGDVIDIAYEIKNDSLNIDTTVLLVNNREIARFAGTNYKWTVNENRVGRQSLRLSMRSNGIEVANAACVVRYFPPAPNRYGYSIVKQYPHNSSSFTQGLFYDDGFIYEGTGQYGKSALMKVELATGKVVKSVNLPNNFFGEGITLIGEKIYQLSWQERQCFVYDKNTFNRISTLSYTNEGWGITTIDNLLAVSNGTSIISFVSPDNFAEIRRIEVCNHNGNVEKLNELELIDGLIWANVWQTNIIVMIDPESGAVVGEIDLTGIYPNSNDEECLNGIAYDSQNKRIFVTGKNWSKLFEIKIVKK